MIGCKNQSNFENMSLSELLKETLFFNSILGSDIQRACSNAINRVLRRRVASKNASEKLENRLTMKDLHECMKRVTPMSHLWRKKYDHWCKQVIRKKNIYKNEKMTLYPWKLNFSNDFRYEKKELMVLTLSRLPLTSMMTPKLVKWSHWQMTSSAFSLTTVHLSEDQAFVLTSQ